MRTLLVVLLFTATVHAQVPTRSLAYLDTEGPTVETGVRARVSAPESPREWHQDPWFWGATAAYWSGVTADYVSTRGAEARGGHELTPFVRNRQGGLSTPKAMAIAGGGYGCALWLQRTGHRRAARIILIVGGALHWGAAAHNWREGR